jgi:prepilin-type N-terminal cleavage/methylation domain-containing protein
MRVSISTEHRDAELCLAVPHLGRNRNRGFTLVEVMLAVAMAAIIFSAVAYGLSTGFNMVQVSREELRANQICLSRMEGIRLCNWNTQLFNTNYMPLTFTDYFYPVGLNGSNNPSTSYITYNGTVTLNTNSAFSPQPSYGGNLCLVTVQVSWSDRSFNTTKARSISMNTLVSKNGIQNYVFSH